MTSWPPIPAVLAQAWPHLLWSLALVLLIAALGCIAATLRTPRRPLVYVAAALLAVVVWRIKRRIF